MIRDLIPREAVGQYRRDQARSVYFCWDEALFQTSESSRPIYLARSSAPMYHRAYDFNAFKTRTCVCIDVEVRRNERRFDGMRSVFSDVIIDAKIILGQAMSVDRDVGERSRKKFCVTHVARGLCARKLMSCVA